MADAHRIAELLEDLIVEVRGIRSDFQAFSAYGTQNMSDAVDCVTRSLSDTKERITGPTGYHLEDVHKELGDIAHTLAMIEINTSS